MMQSKVTLAHLYRCLATQMAALREDSSSVVLSRSIVEAALQSGKTHYGINTGFGCLAQTRIDDDQLSLLQKNLLLSHAVGVGPLISKEISHLMLQLKLYSLGMGYSGISRKTFDLLLAFEEKKLIPVVPLKGSVGASGDLAPLAHLSLPLIGEGYFWDPEGKEKLLAKEVLKKFHLFPVQLAPKDGLALINGTQMMTAMGAFVLERALHLIKVANLLAAMALEAARGSLAAFDLRIHKVRPHPGQEKVARHVLHLTQGSKILTSPARIQDPYSLRCAPQVHGASIDSLSHANQVVETEINSVTDNPLVFSDGEILSGGNFHGQSVAFALDLAAIALAGLANISERRLYFIMSGIEGLPLMLTKKAGLHSGFMILQCTAAALVSENKGLCHPASVDSIPTSMGQEDHVSMGSISAAKLLEVLKNVQQVFALELLAVAQAIDYRKPALAGEGVAIAHSLFREKIPHLEEDHSWGEMIAKSLQFVTSREWVEAAYGKGEIE